VTCTSSTWRDARTGRTVSASPTPDLIGLLTRAARRPDYATLVGLQEALTERVSEEAIKERRARLLRELRDRSPLTQEAVAERKLADLFGVDVDYFFREGQDEPVRDSDQLDRIEELLRANNDLIQQLVSRLDAAPAAPPESELVRHYELAQDDADRQPSAGKRTVGRTRPARRNRPAAG
jgi:hypothetical protein